MSSENHLCNLCGQSCELTSDNTGGLIEASVSGGWDSTAGNGYGALDDMTSYTFSLCEFCLDFLFAQFQIPVRSWDAISGEEEEWKPAAVRVTEMAGTSKFKDHFFKEFAKRVEARRKRKE